MSLFQIVRHNFCGTLSPLLRRDGSIFFLAVPGLRFGIWDLVPLFGIELGPPVFGARSRSHWTTKEVLKRQ